MGGSVNVRVRGVLWMLASTAVLWGTGACGDDSGGDGGGAEATLDDLARAFCTAARECCTRAGMDNPVLHDCESDYATQVGIFESVAAGTTVLRQPQFTQCVNAFRSFTDTCVAADIPPVCVTALSGTVPEGGACDRANECARGQLPVACLKVRTPADQDPVGVCHELARVAVGEPCLTDGGGNYYGTTYSTDTAPPAIAYCDHRDGLFCSHGVDRLCAPFPAEGEACPELECAPGYYCDQTCTRRGTSGAVCDSSEQCEEELTCLDDGHCGATPIATDKTCNGDYN